MALTGVGIIGYSRATALGAGLALLFTAAVPVTMVDAAAGPILMNSAPQHLLGRVLSVLTPVQQVASIAGAVTATALASTTLRGLNVSAAGIHLGRIDAVFLGAGILVLVAGLWVGFPLRAARTAAAIAVPSGTVARTDPVTSTGPVT
jgi:hypothetical protein